MDNTRIEILDAKKTALVVIDLQNFSVGMTPHAPYPAGTVVENAVRLTRRFTEKGAFVVFVRVSFSEDGKDSFRPRTDAPPGKPNFPDGWDVLVPELQAFKNAHIVTKRQMGAFYGTDLDLQLRRRGIDTVVLCGISTIFGVDTTAREAFSHSYHGVYIEDAMTCASKEHQDFVCQNIFPAMGKVRRTDEIALV
ncbi:Nicotinamidase-related amidase [Sporobacter termitidis DSM 10068]|uniref:Nicotinamidase-related amidase n=1 Tax=Sporobacter termitidis DSM 10068 TaxID=1123282 RepID=A0A1M5WFN4_9FIRM|nr:isochorismatase family protein [Sporobacter termitidis]SHH86369.1 Nicotinamidase-related amidase [Sporobacter termitidis DSM 10068]